MIPCRHGAGFAPIAPRKWGARGLWSIQVAATLDVIIGSGGQIVQEIGEDAPEITARFSDPAGNVIGLYQEPARPSKS